MIVYLIAENEIAETHTETNIIEKKNRRNGHRRDRDRRYEGRRNKDRRISFIQNHDIYSQ
jgi:hypothetical protein